MASVRFTPLYARRIPDPVFHDSHSMERHVLLCTASSIPAGLSFDPNARTPNINRAVYKKVRASLLNDGCAPNTFHLKNKGITIVAQSVKRRNDHDYEVFLATGMASLMGPYYELIIKTRETTELPEKQCVKLEILTGVPDDMIRKWRGLNTSVQVQTCRCSTGRGFRVDQERLGSRALLRSHRLVGKRPW